MSKSNFDSRRGDYGPPRLTVELTNICNLHCNYCLRDDEALYGSDAEYFSLELLKRILGEAKQVADIRQISFTGGEPSLHPQFSEILQLVEAEGLEGSFVTNGWNFEKIWPSLLRFRHSISHLAFSLDGTTPEQHDKWRGSGSFVRLVKAFARCNKASIPFVVKVGIRRDLLSQLEQICMFAARLGASGVSFSHLMPTSSAIQSASCLTLIERQIAEQEIAVLAKVFQMNIGINVGYFNTDTTAPCSPLAGKSCNIDYRGRLTLCCNLSGYRGAENKEDVVSNLNLESFTSAYARLRKLVDMQLERRAQAIRIAGAKGTEFDLFTGSPCLFCLTSFGKIPWRDQTASAIPSAAPLVNISSAH